VRADGRHERQGGAQIAPGRQCALGGPLDHRAVRQGIGKRYANLEEVGLPPATFDAVVDGNDVVRKKPAPDIFLEAARRLGLPPETCLVIEDAVSGVAAARAAGSRCLALTTSFSAQELAGADWIAPDLGHVPDEVLAW